MLKSLNSTGGNEKPSVTGLCKLVFDYLMQKNPNQQLNDE